MEELKKILKYYKLKYSGSKIYFFLGNTKQTDNRNYYLTPIRLKKSSIVTGAIVFDKLTAKKILKIIDGLADYVFVDIEIKVKNGKKPLDLKKLAKIVIKKSRLNFYKANDFAVEETNILLNNLISEQNRFSSKVKTLIIGCGNIGFKVALNLIESGYDVYAFRRNFKTLNLITRTINLIKNYGVDSKIKALKSLPKSLKGFDIIITAADSSEVINADCVKGISRKSILIDIGKGNFTTEAINMLMDKSIFIYRLDVSQAYFRHIDNIVLKKKDENAQNYKKNVKNFTLILKGIVGKKNDLIVDDIIKPKRIYGICDGRGSFLNLNIREKLIFTRKLKSVTGLNLKYD